MSEYKNLEIECEKYRLLYIKYFNRCAELEKELDKKIISNIINGKDSVEESKKEKRTKSLSQKIRKQIKLRSKNMCEECGKPARHIHHKDKNRKNNNLDNLIHLCIECHSNYHEHLKALFNIK